MLDNLDTIAKYDNHNALGVIAGQPEQLKHACELPKREWGEVRQVVLAGMGGSALAAQFLSNWLGSRLPVPLIIVRDYDLPEYIGPETLLIASSYSGNTEETRAALAEARKRGAQVAVLTSGGQLEEQAEAHDLQLLETPSGLQPRLAVLYSVRAIAQLLEAVGLVEHLVVELESAADWMMGELAAWLADSPTSSNQAKQIAERLLGFTVIIYGGPALAMPTMKWKIDINENAKNLAFFNVLPEFDHNEFIGWANPVEKAVRVVELQSSLDRPRINQRFELSNRLLSGSMPEPIIVQAKGTTRLQQMLWTIILGDFVSAYLAFLNGIDPTPVELVEKLKKELG